MSDFDDRMNALMGRFAAWKSKGDASPAPAASAVGWDAGSHSDDHLLQSTAAETILRPVRVNTVTPPPLQLPSAPDFLRRPASDSPTSPVLQDADAIRRRGEQSIAAESGCRDNFNRGVSEADESSEGGARTRSRKSELSESAVKEATPHTLLAERRTEQCPSSSFQGKGKASNHKEVSAPVASASDQSAFDSHMKDLEERMLAWKLKAEGNPAVSDSAKSPVAPMQDTAESFVSKSASRSTLPQTTQNSLAKPDTPPTLPVHIATGPASCAVGTSADKNYNLNRCSSQQVSPMTDLVPDHVWASKCPAQHTSYAYLSGMSSTSTRSGCSYAETLPASTGLQEEAVQYPVEPPGTNFSVGSGDVSPNSTVLCTVSQPVQEAGRDHLSRRVSSLEESMHNIEWLLQCLVEDRTEVRNAARSGCRSKAKLLEGSLGSESLEALTSTLGAEPEHEPSRLSEESQRPRLRASSVRSQDGGRVCAAKRVPSGLRHDADKAGEVSEVGEAVHKSKQGDKAVDDERAAPRGRFRWPLDIVRAREELRDQVRKELHARR